MKLAIILCIGVTASLLSAQQLTEWRPNISEDNKAASYEDTVGWIVGELKDVTTFSSDACDATEPTPRRAMKFASGDGPCDKEKRSTNATEFSISSGSRCKLNVVIASWSGAGKHGTVTWDGWSDQDAYKEKRGVLDLDSLDPLSITVKPIPDGRLVLSFEGRNHAVIFANHQWTRQVNLLDVKGAAPIKTLIEWPNACVTDKKGHTKCSETDQIDSDVALTFQDIALAQRAGRAMMHAALVCGGAKSVSPF